MSSDLEKARCASMNEKPSSCLNFPITGASCENSATIVGLLNVLRFFWITNFRRSAGRDLKVTHSCLNTECKGYMKFIKEKDTPKCEVVESVACACRHSIGCKDKEPMGSCWATHEVWKQAVIVNYIVCKSYSIVDAVLTKHDKRKSLTGLLCKKSSGEWVEAWAERICKKNSPTYFKIHSMDMPCPPPASLKTNKPHINEPEETMNDTISPKAAANKNHSGLIIAAVSECQICFEETQNDSQYRFKCACKDENCHLCHDCLYTVISSRKAQPMDLGYAVAIVRTTDSPTCPFCNEPTSKYRCLRGGPWELCAVNYGWYYDRPIVHHIEFKKFDKFFKTKLLSKCMDTRYAHEEFDEFSVSLDNLRLGIKEQSRITELAGTEENSYLKGMRREEFVLVKKIEKTKQKRDKLVEKLPSWLKDKTGVAVELPYEELEAFNKNQRKENNAVTAVARMEARQARLNNRANRANAREIQQHLIVELLSDEADGGNDDGDGDDESYEPRGRHGTYVVGEPRRRSRRRHLA